jgi:D-3-phosphoglycerate dehydrogenase
MSTSPFRVLITDRFDISALAMLNADARLKVSLSSSPQPSPLELAEADGLIIRSRTKITADFLAAPETRGLKLIVTATSGFDHIDLSACEKRGLNVMHTPEANAASACELTWLLVLACARRVLEAHRAVKVGNWAREALVGHELRGKTYAIIGLGRIGSRVAKVAQAFGMKTIGFDPYLDHFPTDVARVSFDECLKLADVISFHVPATRETEGMLNAQALSEMNHHAILVNTSRGNIVRERDLAEALSAQQLAAVGLDVFEREPLPRDSKLVTFPNVVLSPHLGATTNEAFAAASHEAAQKVIDFAAEGRVSDRLPPEARWYQATFRG